MRPRESGDNPDGGLSTILFFIAVQVHYSLSRFLWNGEVFTYIHIKNTNIINSPRAQLNPSLYPLFAGNIDAPPFPAAWLCPIPGGIMFGAEYCMYCAF